MIRPTEKIMKALRYLADVDGVSIAVLVLRIIVEYIHSRGGWDDVGMPQDMRGGKRVKK